MIWNAFGVLAVATALALAGPAWGIDDVVDLGIYKDPDIPAATIVKVFPERLTSLWLQALARPENDLKCKAAATIALGHQRGMKGLETAIEPLLRTLDQPELHSTVRLAVAQALITLDARQAAESLFKHAQTDGIEMRNLVEPALARWDYQAVRAVWLERLKQSGLPGRGWVIAMQGLAAVKEPKAAPRLRELVLASAGDPIIRLEAARALGAIQTAGSEQDATRLLAEKGPTTNLAQLCAASILRNHRGDETAKIQERLALEGEPAAAACALENMLEHHLERLIGVLPKLAARPDATIRIHCAEAHRKLPKLEHVPLIADLMDDPHPQVRIRARKSLTEVAQAPSFRPAVIRETTRHLATQQWRALEQSAILLTLLDHKPAAPRLVELLTFARPEVFVTAAWGLRKLAVPETLPAQLKEIDRRWQQSLKIDEVRPVEMIDLQVAQLAHSIGIARYKPAAPMLTRFVPKEWNIGPESRAAAIWALALIHQQAPPAELVDALIGRLTDESVINIEDMRVRRMSAIALGRMKAREAEASLGKYYFKKLQVELFPNSCGWALEQITGEKLPRSGTAEMLQRGWFLEPSG